MFGISGFVAGHLQDARGYSDEDFKRAIEEGTIRQLLDSMPIELETEGPNQILAPFPGKWFTAHLSGFPNPGYRAQYSGTLFQRVWLTTDTTQYSWTQGGDAGWICWNAGTNVISAVGNVSRYFGAVNTNGLVEEKRISEESNTPTGLRAVHATHTFLWLPSDANVSNIRGIRVAGGESTNVTETGCYYMNLFMQHRFVDSGGTPITIAKNDDQTFCVRWTITYKSI
jgi:hypothetical protein